MCACVCGGVMFPLMLIRLLAMQFIAFSYSRRTHLMHFIVLSLPLFPDQWSYCNVSRNFITVSEIERLRRVDTLEDGLHSFRCCRSGCRCRCLFTSHRILSPWSTRFYGSNSIRIFYYVLQTPTHTLYWLLPQFISSTQWKAMHIGQLHTPYVCPSQRKYMRSTQIGQLHSISGSRPVGRSRHYTHTHTIHITHNRSQIHSSWWNCVRYKRRDWVNSEIVRNNVQ